MTGEVEEPSKFAFGFFVVGVGAGELFKADSFDIECAGVVFGGGEIVDGELGDGLASEETGFEAGLGEGIAFEVEGTPGVLKGESGAEEGVVGGAV